MKQPLALLLASLALAACASSPASQPPRTAAVAPPSLPELPTAPKQPEPRPKQPEPASVRATFHKLREAPDLRTSLLALVPVTGNATEIFEERLTLALLDRGVGRIIPSEALLQVDSSLERPEAGTKGKVRLAAKLSSLALIAGASGADYALYGDLKVSGGAGGGYEIPADAMAAYGRDYVAFLAATDKAERETTERCERALSDHRKRSTEGGATLRVTLQEGMEFNRFQQACALRQAAFPKLRAEVATPAAVEKATREMPPPPGGGSSRATATLKLRQSSNDETFWLGIFDAHAADSHAAIQLVIDRLIQEVTSSWPATPVPVEPDKKAVKKR